MVELHEQANRLREENERLRTILEAGRTGQSRETPRPFPPSRLDKGKGVVAPGDVDLPADDELSSGSSPLPHRSPSPNAAPISFPPINLIRVITPHYDALILTVFINSFDVHRVLIDLDSAADLLHLSAFKQMRVPIDHLHSAGRVLSSLMELPHYRSGTSPSLSKQVR